MRKLLKILYKTVKWSFIVLCIFILSLFFRVQEIPGSWIMPLVERYVPENCIVHVGSVGIGFRHGVSVYDLRVYDRESENGFDPVVSAKSIRISPRQRLIEIDDLKYPRLPESYYLPGYTERNERLDFELPDVERFKLVLTRPSILATEPERVTAEVYVKNSCLSVENIRLDWPDKDEPMSLTGYCRVDLGEQIVAGRVEGTAKQHHIRPLLVALDIPISVVYMDAFTEVPGKIPASCGWKVNLINNDFQLDVGIDTKMGKYNQVAMEKAKGSINVSTQIRGNTLNYKVVIGPIAAVGLHEENLDGTVVIEGVNGMNTVKIDARSSLPTDSLLRIAGFEKSYVGDEVVANTSCNIELAFPEEMTDIKDLRGRGHVEMREGQILKMRDFSGMLELLSTYLPGFSAITDVTQITGDFEVENGRLKSDNILIEGSALSIMMDGYYDFIKDELNYSVRAQFVRSDSSLSSFFHAVQWPFSKLLLEFRLTGTADNPQWRYVSVLDRVLEVGK